MFITNIFHCSECQRKPHKIKNASDYIYQINFFKICIRSCVYINFYIETQKLLRDEFDRSSLLSFLSKCKQNNDQDSC
jgi:hypothetical protein